MADTYGAIELPLAAQGAEEALGDPVLDTVASYLKAVLTAKLQTQWATVSPGAPIVNQIRAYDPAECEFEESGLPALYVWRSDSQLEQVADDVFWTRSQIQCMWIFEPAQYHARTKRSPIFNSIAKAFQVAIELDRDPAWVLPGDPDLSAPLLGSSLITALKAAQISAVSAQVDTLQISVTGQAPLNYVTVLCQFELIEKYDEDSSGLDETAITIDIAANGQPYGTATIPES